MDNVDAAVFPSMTQCSLVCEYQIPEERNYVSIMPRSKYCYPGTMIEIIQGLNGLLDLYISATDGKSQLCCHVAEQLSV